MAADDRLDDPDESRPAGPEFDDADELARRLRDMYRRVRALAVPEEERARFTRRLLAICDVAKRDLLSAKRRLSALQDDLSRHAE